MTTLQGLTHTPYGLEHPYKQQPSERFPRNPMAGQPVTLGVATWPPAAAETVWAEWTVSGTQESGHAPGDWHRDGDEQSFWRVSLPAFTRGQEVTYRLHARQGRQQITSPDFSFAVPGWLLLNRVTGYYFAADHVALICTCEETARRFQLVITFKTADHLHLQWTATSNPLPTTAAPENGRSYRVLQASDDHIHLATPQLHLHIHRRPYRLQLTRPNGTPLLQEAQPPAWLLGAEEQPLQLQQRFTTTAGEAFYSFGERFNSLDQRGQQLDIRVFEQYKNQGTRTYIPVPFFISSRGYGLYVHTARYLAYDLAASDPRHWSFRAETGPSGTLAYDIITHQDPKQILATFTDLTAKPALPPAWAFGPWMSGNDWNSQTLVMVQVEQTQQHNIPATVMVIEAWSDESTFYIWNDARYEPKPGAEAFSYDDFTFAPDGLWPDPKGMIDELHDLGIRLVLWQIPVMKKLESPHPQHERDKAYMVEKGYCVQEADGRPYNVRPFWFHDGLLWDVTHEEGVQWWLEKRAYLLDDLGIDGFKTDGGEHMWGRDLRFANGRKGDELWNLYPNLYAGAYYNFARQKRNGDALTFSRAGFTGAQAFPCHWAGDENSTWEAFRASIVAGLSAGLAGISFWGWDLGGFSGEIPTAELYLRSAAMATFCPIMQYHSEYNARRKPSRDRTPWNIQARSGDERVIPTFRTFAHLRMNLLPYILSEAWQSSQTGIPLMRPLVLEFPDDGNGRFYPYQYLFGSSLLVAPVVAPGSQTWPVYLPPGDWYDFWSGERHSGAQVVECAVPWDRIPVFVRAGAILPLNLGQSLALGSDVGNEVDRYRHLCFKIYGDEVATLTWYDATREEQFHLRAAPQEVMLPPLPDGVTLIFPARQAAQVSINGNAIAASASWEAWQSEETAWYSHEARNELLLKVTASTAERTVSLA